jgi:hypothetical protein
MRLNFPYSHLYPIVVVGTLLVGFSLFMSFPGVSEASILATNSLTAGGGAADGMVTSSGNYDLILQTGNATTGSVTITDGANGNIMVAPNGLGEFVVGNGAADAAVTTSGAYDLYLDTNSGTNSGYIRITDGVGGIIYIRPDGAGKIVVGNLDNPARITTADMQDLILDTYDGTNSGSITITDGVNGNVTVAPNGTGNLVVGNARGVGSSVANFYASFYPTADTDNIASGAGGAISITNYYTTINTDAGGDAYTLADGSVVGQMKKVQMIGDGGGNGTVTPSNTTYYESFTFADVGDFVVFMWEGTGWALLEIGNAVDGVTAPAANVPL